MTAEDLERPWWRQSNSAEMNLLFAAFFLVLFIIVGVIAVIDLTHPHPHGHLSPFHAILSVVFLASWVLIVTGYSRRGIRQIQARRARQAADSEPS